MKLGDLADLLRELAIAEEELERAKESLSHGGNEDTMRRKADIIKSCEEYLEFLRDQEV